MLPLLLFITCIISYTQCYILRCDFETSCNTFTIDNNWGLTDGLHPHSIDHDHTLNDSSGHYLFYNPQVRQRFSFAEIKTTDWLELPNDRAICFQMWYYTPQISQPFTIQLLQGDDERLKRVVSFIPGIDPLIDDWTLVTVSLPAEKIKISVRINVTNGPLAYDDLTVDYCDRPHPSPPETLFACDFESSCFDDFFVPSEYPYLWSEIQASNATKIDNQAPPLDYTFQNESGHYIWLGDLTPIRPGRVGYLITRSTFNFTANESYCLNFQYYGYRYIYQSHLQVYVMIRDVIPTIQNIWPVEDPWHYPYISNKWAWGIINLPIGSYSLVFRMDNTDISYGSFAVDNIAITSCDYPLSTLSPYNAILSVFCDFDNGTMCNIVNGNTFQSPTFNFTLLTGDTVPYRQLGPIYDHTSNSSSGGFLYWNQSLPFQSTDIGIINPSKYIEQNLGMCVRFAYYVKSYAIGKNGTIISLSAAGCYAGSLWRKAIDDSQGWQVVTVPVLGYACKEILYLTVLQKVPTVVSVAFDDIEIAQCAVIDPTTTSTITSTTTESTTTTSTTTSTTMTTTRSSTTETRSTTTVTTSTTVTITTTSLISSSTISGRSNSQRLHFGNRFIFILLCFLFFVY